MITTVESIEKVPHSPHLKICFTYQSDWKSPRLGAHIKLRVHATGLEYLLKNPIKSPNPSSFCLYYCGRDYSHLTHGNKIWKSHLFEPFSVSEIYYL